VSTENIMFVKIKSATNLGLDTIGIDVEINVANRGLPVFDIVGLPSKSVSESKERIKTAIINSKIDFPTKRITINLAPADVPKEGSCYDLPMAVGLLSLMLGFNVSEDSLLFGELSLDGKVRHTRGALLLSLFAKEKGYKKIFVPKESANEAAIVQGVEVYPVEDLRQIVGHFLGKFKIVPVIYKRQPIIDKKVDFDMKEILGQEQAKRAAEIAAAGGHNFMMVGSPGSGKTMLAKALPGILPFLQEKEALEVTKIYSASGNIPPNGSIIFTSPFRNPHHTISQVGLVGGGSKPQPGEISLAHRGVLFLDEFNEFPRSILELLRQPIEDGKLTISRSQARVEYPARFILVASANPCPCGYLLHPKKSCVCSEREIKNYQKRISGPILDRIDLHVEVPVVDANDLSCSVGASPCGCPSSVVRSRVIAAREIQNKRFSEDNIFVNAEMRNEHIKKYCFLSQEVERILKQAVSNFNLSARSYFKVIKIARTIADLGEAESINVSHVAEALQYRPKQA